MIGRIVEISEDNRYLRKERGFLQVKESGGPDGEVGRVPLDDITAVIANSHGLSYTNNLLTELAIRGIPMVFCGPNHHPVGMIWPIEGHHLQGKRIDSQIAAKLPMKKRLWAEVVKSNSRLPYLMHST